MENWLRQHFASPLTRFLDATSQHTMGPSAVPTSPGTPGWILRQDLVDNAGRTLPSGLQDQFSRKAGSFTDPREAALGPP